MSVGRLFRTARYIPPGQLAHRLRFMWRRRRYAAAPGLPLAQAAADAAGAAPAWDLPRVPDDVLWPEGRDAVVRRAADFGRGRFAYLNREADFAAGVRWRDEGASPLWRYQLQYLGCVADIARAGRLADAARILGSWRAEFENRWDPVAWHPYPTSVRLVNLCVAAAFVGGFERLGVGTAGLVAIHAAYLHRHLERDVRGNHVLENARALLWAGKCFRGEAARDWDRTARAILTAEIAEQVLPDGGHFELSPMYHCVVLRELLEVRELLAADDALRTETVEPAILRMGEFLASILCPDGDIPLLGDSVRNFGPPPRVLLRLAGVSESRTIGLRALESSGLYVLAGERVWAILDAGPVCPPYLPAHGQADSLTVEAWVDGTCVVADPGVFDYTGPQRAWGRSSRSHSTATIDDADTSEVYDSFRVGGRATIESVGIAQAGDEVVARVRPFGTPARITRSVRLFGNSLTIEDTATGGPRAARMCSRLHLAPGVGFVLEGGVSPGAVKAAHSRVADVLIEGEAQAETGRVSREFGRVEESTLLVQRASADGGRVRWVIGPA